MSDLKTYAITEGEKKGHNLRCHFLSKKDERIIFAYIFGSFVDPEMLFFRDIHRSLCKGL